MLEQGPVEKKIIEESMRDRRQLPEKIQNAPSLLPGLNLFFAAFCDLESCRALGFGEGPIPWTAIASYCGRYGMSEEQEEDMFYHVRVLDVEYLKYKARKNEDKKPKGKK